MKTGLFSGTNPVGAVRRQALAELSTTVGWYILVFRRDYPIGLVPDNVWTHLAMTYDAGAAAITSSSTRTVRLLSPPGPPATSPRGTATSLRLDYNGRWEMDEVRLWNRALSQTRSTRICTGS